MTDSEKALQWLHDTCGHPHQNEIEDHCFIVYSALHRADKADALVKAFEKITAALGTETTMHQAWEKRAYQAEAELEELRKRTPVKKTWRDFGEMFGLHPDSAMGFAKKYPQGILITEENDDIKASYKFP